MLRLMLLHDRLQVTITLVLLVLAAWGLILFLRGKTGGNGYRAALTVAALLIGSEVLLGILLLFAGLRPPGLAMHLVYGFVAVTAIPALLLYTRDRTGRMNALISALVSLLLAGVAVRAWETGIGL